MLLLLLLFLQLHLLLLLLLLYPGAVWGEPGGRRPGENSLVKEGARGKYSSVKVALPGSLPGTKEAILKLADRGQNTFHFQQAVIGNTGHR